MTETQSYHIVELGKHSTRRDYSKVSGSLELPNLVEIQTDSFKWFVEEGIKEVFEDIYPIQNFSKNIRLKAIPKLPLVMALLASKSPYFSSPTNG